ncbi:MAG: MFS transporter, partial [Chitinophagaceae bacterium]
MNQSKMFQWSLVAALAGFIFGFDTVVISGANLPIKNLWHTSPLFHGFFIMSMALWGTLVGSVFGGGPTEKYGRKKVLLFIGIIFAISAVGSALAQDPYTFSFFRFIGGVGIGVSSVVAPTYISEISTPATRGRLGAMYQFNIVFGILIAFLSNYLLQGVGGENDWRWMLGVLAIPSVIYTVLVFYVPESPRWLMTKKGDRAKAMEILLQIGVENPEAEIQTMERTNESDAGKSSQFFSKKNSTIIWLAFMVAFFNQLSGINFILYYAPEILTRIGLGTADSLLNSIAIGGTNLLFTFTGLYLIDRLGRRNLMLIGSVGY